MQLSIIFLTIAGSHLYGLDTADSDIDLRGVAFDPVSSLLGLQGFEQYQPNKNESEVFSQRFGFLSDDIVIYGLKKFCQLALNSNPNIIELFFAPNYADNYQEIFSRQDTRWWDVLVANKYLFLSQKARHTFAGYAYSQLSRIKGHRRWVENPPIKPDPHDFGMVLTDKGGQRWTDSNKYNQYQSLSKDHQSYQVWLRDRNPKRKELEVKFGYDTKHAMHLFRLILEARELLTTGNITLPLDINDIRYLRGIRDGLITYNQLIDMADNEIESLKEVGSELPNKPNFKAVDELLISIYQDIVRDYDI